MPDPALPTPADPPEWAMREARGLLRKSCPPSNIYDTCPIASIARALVTARREALIEVRRYHSAEAQRHQALANPTDDEDAEYHSVAAFVHGTAVGHLIALIDKEPA